MNLLNFRIIGLLQATAATALLALLLGCEPNHQGPAGMVLIPGGEFNMGSEANFAFPNEKPVHRVQVAPFFLDVHPVTNAEFAKFVEATGYKTVAERAVQWEEMQKQLPPGTPKPPEEVLQPGSLVFRPTSGPVDLRDMSQWWVWTTGASWKNPEGQGSSIQGRENHPVVQIAWEDAQAYAKWAGKRLPTEAEWEFAARGGENGKIHPWGDEPPDVGSPKANVWDGIFPRENTSRDGHVGAAPVRSYPPNAFGLYDMSGNVWEWTSDWYRQDAYARRSGEDVSENPRGPDSSYDPEEPHAAKKVQRGGSFLCHESYCASYRTSARMKTTTDTGLSHSGFRCVRDP